eukprot:354906-Chlamydomonas_euryale.AAC.5
MRAAHAGLKSRSACGRKLTRMSKHACRPSMRKCAQGNRVWNYRMVMNVTAAQRHAHSRISQPLWAASAVTQCRHTAARSTCRAADGTAGATITSGRVQHACCRHDADMKVQQT